MSEGDPEAPYGRKRDGTPKKPSGFQAGGAQHRPPGGAGWGGPASGNAGDKFPKPFDDTTRINFNALTAEQKERLSALKAMREIAKEERVELLTANLIQTALFSENETLRLNATVAGLNRLEGMPQQSVKTEGETVVKIVGGLPDED